MVGLLSGCLLTSPFWWQEFNNRTDPIPIQSWTVNKNVPITIECSKATHGSLYPYGGPENWSVVANLNPQLSGVLDPKGNVVYSAGTKIVLPESCWELSDSRNFYYTAIRAKQGNTVFISFDNNGLECLGRWNGKLTSWLGWSNKGCIKTNPGDTSTPIPHMIIKAKQFPS